MFQPSSDVGMKKVGPLAEKIFSGFCNRISPFQRKKLRKTDFSFQNFHSFWYHFWRLSNFFVVLQTSSVRCVKTPVYMRREKKLGKTNVDKLLLYQFWTLSRKKLDFQQNSKAWFAKTVAYVSGGTMLVTFLEQHYLYKNFRSLNGMIGCIAKFFSQGCQRRISRVQCNTLRKRWWK